MTYAGVADNTKLQMRQVLFNDACSDEEVHRSFAELVTKLSEAKTGYELTNANRMYAQEGLAVVPNFIGILSKYYRNEVHAVDFKSQAGNVTKKINDWVSETTKQRIKDLLAPDVLTAYTRLVLVNAIYFKGAWASQFGEYNTEKSTFYAAANREIKVDMMHQTESFKYSEHNDCQVLCMYYEQYELAMYVFLPKKRNGLTEFEKSLTGARMLQLIGNTHHSTVEVHLPKFRLEMSFGLNDALTAMGMPDLFDGDKADLSNMTGDKSLHVSAVIHKAFGEVNEKGSEAAAATAVVAVCECLEEGPVAVPPKFVADHPFLFTITDGKSLLFLGRFTG